MATIWNMVHELNNCLESHMNKLISGDAKHTYTSNKFELSAGFTFMHYSSKENLHRMMVVGVQRRCLIIKCYYITSFVKVIMAFFRILSLFIRSFLLNILHAPVSNKQLSAQ